MLATDPPSTATRDERRGNDLVEEHLHLVDHVVRQLSATYPRHVDRDELRNAGALGLVDAARRYEPSGGVPFGRYAMIRIRGAVLDQVRSRDWASRSVRRGQRERRAVAEAFLQEHGRSPNAEELAQALGVTTERIESMQADVAAAEVIWLDKPVRGEGGTRTMGDTVVETDLRLLPQEHLENKELHGTLHAAISLLPDQQRDVVQRVYFDGESQVEVAGHLGLTEPRISQIRAEAEASIRAYFANAMGASDSVEEPRRGGAGRTSFVHRVQDETTWRDRLDAGPTVIDLRD